MVTAYDFETGQRVAIVTADGLYLPGRHTVAATQHSRAAGYLRIKTVIGEVTVETRHEDWHISQVRIRRRV